MRLTAVDPPEVVVAYLAESQMYEEGGAREIGMTCAACDKPLSKKDIAEWMCNGCLREAEVIFKCGDCPEWFTSIQMAQLHEELFNHTLIEE